MQPQPSPPRQPEYKDPTEYCPNCGHKGVSQKCKLICENPDCSVRIILACVD